MIESEDRNAGLVLVDNPVSDFAATRVTEINPKIRSLLIKQACQGAMISIDWGGISLSAGASTKENFGIEDSPGFS
jgi:hypothetical protein